jgi:hypothetical protein
VSGVLAVVTINGNMTTGTIQRSTGIFGYTSESVVAIVDVTVPVAVLAVTGGALNGTVSGTTDNVGGAARGEVSTTPV